MEATKGCKVDSKGEGITGWNVPDLALKDSDGNAVSLAELSKGKTTVIVLYTLNGVTWKHGDKEGKITSEVKGAKLVNAKKYGESQGEEFNEKAASGNLRGLAKMALTEATASDDFFSAIMNEESPSDRDKAAAYASFLQHMQMVQDLIK